MLIGRYHQLAYVALNDKPLGLENIILEPSHVIICMFGGFMLTTKPVSSNAAAPTTTT